MQKKPQIAKTAPVRVRFAPSPTGYLHVGGARTALFNWLFARKMGGTFVLRIEDTDAERSTEESMRGILEGLRWLGLEWDEGPEVGGDCGPYQQTLRHVLYSAEADRLLREGRAYHCFCTREDLDAMREQAARAGQPVRYDGRCGRLDPEESKRRLVKGAPAVVRLRMPADGEVAWVDLGRGEVRFQMSLLDDFVLLKTDGNPTYNFAVVVDDAKMRISHVIRGDDHISNTPRQLVLFDALGFQRPEFVHLPMIVGPDRTRLSKRHGATSVTQFRDQGYLPRAMVNYLALLGWAYDGEREFFTPEELVSFFDLKNISRNPAVFDVQKLRSMNYQHFSRLSFGGKVRVLLPQMKRHGLWPPRFRIDLASGPRLRVVTGSADEKIAGSIQPVSEEEWMRQEPSLVEELPRLKLVLEALGNRLGGPHDVEVMDYFYADDHAFDSQAVSKHLSGEEVPCRLRALAGEVDAFDLPEVEREPGEHVVVFVGVLGGKHHAHRAPVGVERGAH
ncbi:MAG: glutamate--tRNA ligase, partial [Candidatus Krumholzibacteriia bacterium]